MRRKATKLFHLLALVTAFYGRRALRRKAIGGGPDTRQIASLQRVWRSVHRQMSGGLVPASCGQIVAPFALGIVRPSSRGHDVDGEQIGHYGGRQFGGQT